MTKRETSEEVDHQDVWHEGEVDYLDALDVVPACPRCSSPDYEYDEEFRAYTCNACGLWIDDEDVED